MTNPRQSVKKLTDLAKQLRTYQNQLFTCVTHEGVAATNNKAERKLRHIVLKRKNCFGTKTERGNMIMEINMSVLLSLWWNKREQFFPKFKELMDLGLNLVTEPDLDENNKMCQDESCFIRLADKIRTL